MRKVNIKRPNDYQTQLEDRYSFILTLLISTKLNIERSIQTTGNERA